jgi:hypothetical protein
MAAQGSCRAHKASICLPCPAFEQVGSLFLGGTPAHQTLPTASLFGALQSSTAHGRLPTRYTTCFWTHSVHSRSPARSQVQYAHARQVLPKVVIGRRSKATLVVGLWPGARRRPDPCQPTCSCTSQVLVPSHYKISSLPQPLPGRRNIKTSLKPRQTRSHCHFQCPRWSNFLDCNRRASNAKLIQQPNGFPAYTRTGRTTYIPEHGARPTRHKFTQGRLKTGSLVHDAMPQRPS